MFVCNAITQKRLQQSHPKFHRMFIRPRVFVAGFWGNLGFHVRGVRGVGRDPPNSTTSNFDEIYTIYVNLTEEQNGLAPESLGGHLRGLGGAAAPFQILKKTGLAVTM